MTATRRRAAKYRRISDDREGLELGVTRQDEDLDQLAQRNHLDIVADFVDNDLSASTKSKKERLDYRRMLQAARAGEFEVIIAYTSGRLTRRPREHEDLIDLSLEHGIEFLYVRSPSFDLNTAQGRRIARTLAAQDAGEAEEIAERVQRAARQRAENGQVSGGGTRPFGYEPNRVTIRESEAMHIRKATKALLAGTTTIHGLCRDWNDGAEPVTTVTGIRWKPHVLRRMLMSARISGRREHKRAIVADAVWPGIISPQQSDQLRELLSDPARTTNTERGGARKYLLTGFLYCGIGECSRKLKARPQADHQRSYVCADIGMSHLRMIAEPLELYVKEAALDYLDEFIGLASAVSQADESHAREAELWGLLSNYQTRLERLQSDFYVHERLPEARFNALASELEAEMATVRLDLARVRDRQTISNLPSSSAVARKLWKDWNLDRRRTLIDTLVERVTIGPGARGLNKFDDKRVKIKFRQPY